MSLGILVGIPGMPDVGGALGPTPPDNARVTTSGAYRVTTDGAFRVWTAGAVLPDVDSAVRLLDIRASAAAIASLTNGDPVATVANAGTVGGSFTQSGSARPTKRTDAGGHPYLEFDGVDDYMELGATPSAALDDLVSMAIFLAIDPGNATVIAKETLNGDVPSWEVDTHDAYFFKNGQNYLSLQIPGWTPPVSAYIASFVKLSNTTGHLYINGDNTGESITSVGTLDTFSNAETVKLATYFEPMNLRAIRIYQITDAAAWDASDRQAIIEDMAADTGITL